MVKYQEFLEQRNLTKESPAQFENWLVNKIKIRKEKSKTARTQEVIRIPVVVHIIHAGESIGVGRNISDQQVFSQIDVLNEDFRRTNADAANTPAVFEPVASDIEIEFVLAQRDPEGLATNGINRVNGNQLTWFLADNYTLKTLSNWPSEDYLNIWVTALGDGFLGYAQFPVSDIGGLETASASAITDGIVVDYLAFGSVAKDENAVLDSRYDLGRTTTHEVGHYLGLRHIWGDGGCGVDDFCADTPRASNDNNGLGNCSFPGPSTCGSDDMFQNYMDFTNDVCMNLFTEDQKTRMRTVIDNSPRRASLINSLGAEPPVPTSNDLGIRNILSPGVTTCDTQVSPSLEIRNYGTNQITAAQIQTELGGIIQGTDILALDLGPLEITTVELSPIVLSENENNNLTFTIISTNGVTDGNNLNNISSVGVSIPQEVNGSITVNFNEIPSDWVIDDDDELVTWELRSVPNGEPDNKALTLEFFRHENQGDLDLFTSPLLDFTAAVSILTFDVAYAKFVSGQQTVEMEALSVIVSENCENPLEEGDVVYFKQAEELKTAGNSGSSFTPSGAQDWRTETIDLSAYLGRDNMQVSFVARNDFGNNLYIDNISLLTEPIPGVDLIAIQSPSPVSNRVAPELVTQLKNSGAVPLEKFNVNYVIDDLDTVSITVETSIAAGNTFSFSDQITELSEGTHRLYFSVDSPNDTTDFNPINNSQILFFEINTSEDFAPFKESFSGQESAWVSGNPDNNVTWIIKDGVASIDLSIYEAIGEQDWLAGPTIDLSEVNQATLNFDYSYSHESIKNDGLAVFISRDGGASYEVTSFNRTGIDLVSGLFLTGRTETEFENVSIALTDYLGESEVRIAFVSTNDNGDPIFVDNIQVFTTDFFLESDVPIFPNPTFNGRFNVRFELDQREDVNIILFNTLGHSILEANLPNTINQTYTFNIGDRAQGLYFIQVRGETFGYVERILKSN